VETVGEITRHFSLFPPPSTHQIANGAAEPFAGIANITLVAGQPIKKQQERLMQNVLSVCRSGSQQ